MKKIRILSLVIILVTLVVMTSAAIFQTTTWRQPSPEEIQSIKDTFSRKFLVDAEAYQKLDPGVLSEVYINDKRGNEKIDQNALDTARFVRNDKSLSAADLGLLDIHQIEIQHLKLLNDQWVNMQKKLAAEGRTKMSAAEAASLRDETGAFAQPYQSEDTTIRPQDVVKYNLTSIVIQDDTLAKVEATQLAGEEEYILVKVGDRWFIAGQRTININF